MCLVLWGGKGLEVCASLNPQPYPNPQSRDGDR